jgi:uncharacterized membrane protein
MPRTTTIWRITITALMSALIFVLTVFLRIPTPVGGYVHLGDVGITFAALAFGPWIAAAAGGLGTALADISGGYAQFAFFSFLVHGFQGIAVGLIVRRKLELPALALAVVVGALIVTGGYFLVEVALYGMGEAFVELVPNLIQGLVGGVIGVPLYMTVRKAYPPLSRYRGYM